MATPQYRPKSSLIGAIGIASVLFLGGCTDQKHQAANAPPQGPTSTSQAPSAAIVETPAQSPLVAPSIVETSDDFLEPAIPANRNWSNLIGHHVEATFSGLDGDNAVLKKLDGKQVSVPIAKLSDDDFNYLHSIGTRNIGKRQLTGKVVGITDGDAIIIRTHDNRQIKIRLAGIDTPEKAQTFGPRAREALAKKIVEKEVRIDWQGQDKYGRTIGDIYLDGRWINKEMVQEGWAWHYLKYSDSTELAAAEKSARSSRAGLWRDDHPEPPWEYRHREKTIMATVVEAPPKPTRFQTPPDPPPLTSQVTSSPPSDPSEKTVQVKCYYRQNGTYVEPHSRSRPHKK